MMDLQNDGDTPVNGFTSAESPVLDVRQGFSDDEKIKYGVVPMEQFKVCIHILKWKEIYIYNVYVVLM